MEQPLISVIVPVYNAEENLAAAVEGLLKQTYTNLEIILIDDGSTDGSPALCDRLAEEDKRIVALHQKNAGVSAARNTGLKAAKGELIGFCDADDYPCVTMFERLARILIENDCDAVHQDFITQTELKTDFSVPAAEGSVELKNRDECVKWVLTRKNIHGTGVWSHLFRRKVTEGVEFPVGMAIGEDKFFILLSFLNCEKVAFYSGKEYIYVVRKNSSMHVAYDRKNLTSVTLANRTEELINKSYPQYKEYAVINKYKVYITNIRNINHFNLNDKVMKDAYDEIISFLKQQTPGYVFSALNKRETGELRLIKFSLPLYKLYIAAKEGAAKLVKS